VAALVSSAQAAGARQKPPDTQAVGASVASQPIPSSVAKYDARLFELVEPGEKQYDAAFARQLRSLVGPQLAKNDKFLARLTSGPAAAPTYVATPQHAYFHYGICQAHQCDITNMDILFDPARNRMVGKLLDSCKPQWLGHPDEAEMALLDERHRASFPATGTSCAGDK
jgi:hypothetical protein